MLMEIDVTVVVIVVVVVIAVLLWFLRRNRQDRKDMEQTIRSREIEPEKHRD